MDNLGHVDAIDSIHDPIELTDITTKADTIDDDSSLIIEKERDGNLRKLTISNCDSLESAIYFIKSSEFREELEHRDCIFHIQFIIDEIFRELTESEVEELGQILKDNQILVTFESSECKQFYTLWSNKEIEHFLKLNSHKEVYSRNDKNFFKFINKVLIDSLQNGQLGLVSTHSRSSDANNIDVQFLADSGDRNLYAIAAEQKNKEIQKYITKNIPNLNIKTESSFKRKLCIILIILCCFVIIFGVLVLLLEFLLYKLEYSYENLSITGQEVVRNGLIDYNGVEVKFRDLFTDESYAYNWLDSDHIHKIFNGQILNFTAEFEYFDHFLYFNWTNLNEKLKQKMLNLNTTFQGEKVLVKSLHEIHKNAFETLNSDQIERILNEKYFEIGSEINYKENFHISREFINENIYPIYYEFMVNESQKEEANFHEFYDKFMSLEFDQYNLKISEIRANLKFQKQFDQNFDDFLSNFSKIQSFKSDETEIIEKVKESRIFILSGEAGVGKSLALEHIALKFKEKYPLKWISVIDLSNYKNFFNFSSNSSNVELFLEEMLELTSDNEFEKTIFENSLKSDNVVLFWDGFDVLSNESSQILTEITKNIYENTKNIQFFGIRSSASKLLTDTFNISAHLLIPMDEPKIEEFLSKYLETEYFDDDDEDDKALAQSKTKEILEVIHDLFENSKIPSDLSNPFILETIADFSLGSFSGVKSKNHFKIFSFIIDQKFTKWIFDNDYEQKFYSDENFDERLLRIFQKFAIKSKIPSISNPLTQIYTKKLSVMHLNESSVVPNEEYTKMGILNFKDKKMFKFVHKTFVDFFVAQFIAENMKNSNDVDTDELILITQLLFDILNSKPEDNRLIFKFLESFLQSHDNYEQFNSIIDVIKKFFRRNLFNIFKNEDLRSFKLLMHILKNKVDILFNMLQVNQSETLYTASFNPIYFSGYNRVNFNRSELIQIVKQSANLSAEDFESFVKGKDQKGVILYGLYYFRENFGITLDSDEYGLDWVDDFEVKKINLLSLSSSSKIISTSGNQTTNFVQITSKTMFNEAINVNDIATNLTNSNISSSNLTSNSKDLISNKTILSIDNVTSKPTKLTSNLKNDSLNLMNHTITQETSKLDSESLLKLILQNLTEFEQKELFLLESTPIIDEKLIIKTYFWEKAKEILTREIEIKILVFNIFNRIHKFSNLKSEDFSNLFYTLGSYLNDEEFFEVMSRGKILHRSAANPKIFKNLWEYFVSRTNIEQREKILLQTVDDECFGDHKIGQQCYDTSPLNIFHIALLFSKDEEMFNYVKEIYNSSDLYTWLLNSNSILPYSFLLCNLGRFKNYLLFLETRFINSEISWRILFSFLFKQIDKTNSRIGNYFENTSEILEIDKKLSLVNELMIKAVKSRRIDQTTAIPIKSGYKM